MEYFEDKFRLRESLELCRMWEKNFVVESYLIEDAERKEKRGTRLGICQKIYTTQFSGERILHTENA